MRTRQFMCIARLEEYGCFVAVENGILLTCCMEMNGSGRADDLGNLIWEPVRPRDSDWEFLAEVDSLFGTSFRRSIAFAA